MWESSVRVRVGLLTFNEGIIMFSTILTALKFVICIFIGPGVLCGIIESIFGEGEVVTLLYLVSCFFWISYCWNYYYPREIDNTAPKKESDDNDVDFKDL